MPRQTRTSAAGSPASTAMRTGSTRSTRTCCGFFPRGRASRRTRTSTRASGSRSLAPSPAAAARPLVVHAPTHRAVKGTSFVLDAVSRLQADGLDFDFQLIEDMTQTEARSVYGRADVVVDQLLVGWYGGLAVEAMALARPTVAFLREEDLGPLPEEMRSEIPVISAEPQTIEAVLKELLTTRRPELAEIGRRGRDYVQRWHDPVRIARGLVADYEAALARKRSVTQD